MAAAPPPRRLAELVGVLAMATDLGLGLPLEHTVRTCLLAMALGRRAGLGEPELSDLYYVTLLRMLGCTAESDYHAEVFGDEVAFGRDTQHLDYGDPAAFGAWVMSSFATDRPADVRERMLEKLFTFTPERHRANLLAHCEVARMLGTRLGLGPRVVEALGYVFERWDGTGAPSGRGGEDLPVPVRVTTLCNEVEIHARLGGPDAAAQMVRQRSGGAFDPTLADLFLAERDALLAVFDRPALWSDVLTAEPAPHRLVDARGLDEAARVIGDFADLKSTSLIGHSRAVAGLVTPAAARLRLDAGEQRLVELAALMQDLGRVGVTTAIWDKRGPLDDAEWERVRLHSYYSERLLTRASATQAAGHVAGMHHEHPDGSGYHRGTRRSGLPASARLLAAADAYVAMRRPRPHRPALEPDEAADALRRMGAGDRLDAAAVNAVLAAVGDTGPRVRRPWPAGLTDREVDVLRRVAQGGSMQDAARDLHLSVKTVDFHLQNIYAKAGVSTRAAATMFAVQNDLLEV